jgi:hypothetical protein
MILKTYLQSLLEYIEICPLITNVNILRHDYHCNESEQILLFRLKVYFIDHSTLELFERVLVMNSETERTKYSYHWQNNNNKLIHRWDNAPHHPELSSFPHHQHNPSETIASSDISGLDILKHIARILEKKS